jgi:two-component system, sensor histidine kinase YesM
VKKLLHFLKNMSVSWKFVLAYFAVLIVPIILSGIYLYNSTSDTAISQAKLVMEQNLLQTKASILQKVNVIEKMSQMIAFDKNLRDILNNEYDKETYRVEDYQFNISPFISNILQLNKAIYAIRIYCPNTIITEMTGSYYSINRIDAPKWFQEMSAKKPEQNGWISTHDAMFHALRQNNSNLEQVFSINTRISSNDTKIEVGFLEMEVTESLLFDMLRDPVISQWGEVFVVDSSDVIVSNNIPEFYMKNISKIGLGNYKNGEKINLVEKVENENSIVISIPVKEIGFNIVGVFPVSHFTGEVKRSMPRIILIILVSLLLLGLIIYAITNALLSRLKKLVKAMKQVRDENLDVSVPVKVMDEFGVLALNFNRMTGRIHELVETVYKIQLMERDAELKALEAQINPHFLYNTLATISWAARKANSPEIVKISNSLAKFYRLVLSKGDRLISIKEELDMVISYLHIQKIRFEDMFDVVYEIEEAIYDYKVVKNILQPLVENALNHGVEPKRGHGTIIIKAGEVEGKLFFSIIDDGIGMKAGTLEELREGRVERSGRSGYAVKNIMQRIKSYYGDGCSFTIFSKQGIGTVITIVFSKRDD